MPRAVDITFTVNTQGQLHPSQAAWLRAQLKQYAGREVRIQLSNPKRSTRQNKLYWAFLSEIRDAMYDAGLGPCSTKALHIHFKRMYLPPETEVVFGKDETLDPTTTNLDTAQFSDYIMQIQNDERVLALGVYLELPDLIEDSSIAEPK